ncbi:MAG: hypothetical protein Aurels2KO_13460 [Aureliella sp.]
MRAGGPLRDSTILTGRLYDWSRRGFELANGNSNQEDRIFTLQFGVSKMLHGLIARRILLSACVLALLSHPVRSQQPALELPTVPAEHPFAPQVSRTPISEPEQVNAISQVRTEHIPQNQTRIAPPPALQPPGSAPEEDLPVRNDIITMPVQPPSADVRVQANRNKVTIFARDVDVRLVLAHLSEEAGVNIVIGPGVAATVNISLTGVTLQQALDAILKINGIVWTELDGIVYVTQPSAAGEGSGQVLGRGLRGQRLEVFELNFVSAEEVLAIVKTLLSPSGTANVHTVDQTSTRQTRERIVVEDFEDRLDVIREYLATVDNTPMQVLIEAHVLQVTLDNDQRHGVNLLGLARISGARVEVRSQGFADGSASPGFMMGVDGNDLDGMIEMLCASSYVRTLAAPKVMVVNGQQARIQIGSKFGYFETTTTQTGTFQNVNFLDIGVVLQVTPTITDSGQVMLAVEPKVSGGRVNPETGLPEEDTTEALTTVVLPDGKGMIIGGLIKEEDDFKKSWVPWIGEKPFIGKLFSRKNDDKQRTEVIIALTPHIVPYSVCVNQRESQAYRRATDANGILSGGTIYTPAYEHSSPGTLMPSNVNLGLIESFPPQPVANGEN